MIHFPLYPNRKLSNRENAHFSDSIKAKIINNYATDWKNIAHIVTMAYNIFPHSSTGEASFYLMFWLRCIYVDSLQTTDTKNLGTWEMRPVVYIWMLCKKFIC